MDDGSVKTGTLNLVDLAGSERIAKTNASGTQLEEVRIRDMGPELGLT